MELLARRTLTSLFWGEKMPIVGEIKIVVELPLLELHFGKETWELKQLGLKQYMQPNQCTVYTFYHNGYLHWIESTQGIALEKFMAVIPNEIRDKIKEQIK